MEETTDGRRIRRAGSRAVPAALGAALILVWAPAAGAVSPETAIKNLNAQRSASGIPAISVDPALSGGCAKHDDYMRLNGGVLTHDEVATSSGFTLEGQMAGKTSVLASGAGPWSTPRNNPWETAPVHLAQLLDPSLLVSGYDESFGFSCAATLAAPRRAEPAAPLLYTYPGPKAKIYSAERAAEAPFTPGQLAGLRQGAITGPYIFVFVDGVSPFSAVKPQITAASLRRIGKRGGKVKVRRIDSTNPQLAPYIPPGGMVIPVHRLRKGAYRAAVTVNTGAVVLRSRWKFRAV